MKTPAMRCQRGRLLPIALILGVLVILAPVTAESASPLPGSFVQQAKLTGDTTVTHGFGQAVAVSADGNTAIIGAPYENHNVGAAYIVTRSGKVWAQQGPKFTPHQRRGYTFRS